MKKLLNANSEYKKEHYFIYFLNSLLKQKYYSYQECLRIKETISQICCYSHLKRKTASQLNLLPDFKCTTNLNTIIDFKLPCTIDKTKKRVRRTSFFFLFFLFLFSSRNQKWRGVFYQHGHLRGKQTHIKSLTSLVAYQ